MKYLFALFLIPSQAFTAELSLFDALQKVEGQNAEIRAAKAQAQASEYGYEAAAGKYFPRLDFESRYTHLNDDIMLDLSPVRKAIIAGSAAAAGASGGAPAASAVSVGLNSRLPSFDVQVQKQDYYNAALTLTQPIYTGGKINANRDARYSEWKGTELQSQDTRDRLIVSTAQAYFAVRLTDKAMEVRKELRDRLKRHQNISEKLLAEGQITKVAKMNGDVKLAEAESELLRARHENEMAWNVLSNLLNEKLEDCTLTTELGITAPMEPVAKYQEKALAQNKALKGVDRKLEMLDAKYEAVRADQLPSVFAFGRYELYKDDLTLLEPEWYVGVGVKMNIFAGGELKNNMAQVRAEQSAARSLKQSAEQNMNLAVQKLYSDMQIANDQYESLQSTVQLAEKSVELNTASYQNGVIRSLDVTDAYATLASAKLLRLKSLYDYNIALFQLKRLTGETDDLLLNQGKR